MYRHRLNNIIYRTFHNHTHFQKEKYTLREKLVLFTKGNMVTMGILNSGYGLYILHTHTSPFNKYSIFDTSVTAVSGLYLGAIGGFIWPLTYCIIGTNLYHKYYKPKRLE